MRYRWAVLAAGTTTQASFSAITIGLAVLAPVLREEFHLSLGKIGILSATWVGALVKLLPWGLAVHRYGERVVLTLGLAGCAACLGSARAPGEGEAMWIRRVVPNIRGENLDESRVFYTEVIGLEHGMDLGWIIGFVSPTNETAQLQVIREDASAPVAPDVTIEVGDVDTVHAQAVAHGAEIVYPPTEEAFGVRRFFVRDPNGAVINVMQHLE